MKKYKYDLEQRLLEYSARVIKVVESLPATRVGNHIAEQFYTVGLRHILIMEKHKQQNPARILFIKYEYR
jgi:hypothetical protein